MMGRGKMEGREREGWEPKTKLLIHYLSSLNVTEEFNDSCMSGSRKSLVILSLQSSVV